jgi:hypothetical protein
MSQIAASLPLGLFEELEQVWAGRMIELLVAACHEVNEAGGALSVERVADFRTR